MKKRFAAKEGFTLVELIVVIAILGILAGVAVPAYSGYLNKAKEAAIVTELDAVKTAAQSANALAGDSIKEIHIEKNSTASTKADITITSTYVNATEGAYLSKSFIADFKTFYAPSAVTGVTVAPNADSATNRETTFTGVAIDLGDGAYKNGVKWTPAAGWTADAS